VTRTLGSLVNEDAYEQTIRLPFLEPGRKILVDLSEAARLQKIGY
jgi:hypothetical protein